MAMDTLTVVLAFVATLCFFTVCLVVAIKGHETVAVKIIEGLIEITKEIVRSIFGR